MKPFSGLVECNDTTDWVRTPLAFVSPINPPEEYLPCNIKWRNRQQLMSDKSCVRFTAASEGPIYFALSQVPSLLETWYYLRIARVCVYQRTFYTNIDRVFRMESVSTKAHKKQNQKRMRVVLLPLRILISTSRTSSAPRSTWKTMKTLKEQD